MARFQRGDSIHLASRYALKTDWAEAPRITTYLLNGKCTSDILFDHELENGGLQVLTELDLESIVTELYSPLYWFAFALTRNQMQAADFTQETFLILARRQAQVRDVTKVKSWLFTTLRHEFLRSLRTQSSYLEVELKPEHQDQLVTDPAMLQASDVATALKALEQVDAGYRMVLELFYQADLSYKEIAATLDIPIGTVMSRLSRGKEQLRTLLAKTTPPRVNLTPGKK